MKEVTEGPITVRSETPGNPIGISVWVGEPERPMPDLGLSDDVAVDLFRALSHFVHSQGRL